MPEATDLELHGEGDDRLDVWIDDELVIRRTPPSDMYLQATTLALGAGIHRSGEYEQHGGTTLQLLWSPPNGRPRPLPSHYLFREPPDENDIRLAEGAELLRRAVLILGGAPLAIGLVWVATPAGTVRERPPPQYRRTLSRRSGRCRAGERGYALIIWFFIRNACVTEDAYIIFRSVEQLFAGNGAEPNERVQAFTSRCGSGYWRSHEVFLRTST